MEPRPPSTPLPWRTLGAVLVLLAALVATRRLLAFQVVEGATGAMRITWPWWRSFVVSLGELVLILPLLPLVRRQVRALPLSRTPWTALLARHLLWSVLLAPAFVALNTTGHFLSNLLVSGPQETWDLYRQLPWTLYASSLAYGPLTYGVMAIALHAWDSVQEAREREHQALRLERELAQAQLEVMRHQLSPHFLFNTLNGITALIRRDPEVAEQMILALTDFLRTTLEQGARPTHPLSRELALLDRYLEIQQLRFPGRLRVVRDLAPQTLDRPVPTLLLQPLAENAIRHGLGPRAEGGTLTLRAREAAGDLHLEVEDDGLGDQAKGGGTGLGLSHTRERLAQLYSGRASFAAGPRPEGGYRVAITLPEGAP